MRIYTIPPKSHHPPTASMLKILPRATHLLFKLEKQSDEACSSMLFSKPSDDPRWDDPSKQTFKSQDEGVS
jgi:hypothetical protein